MAGAWKFFVALAVIIGIFGGLILYNNWQEERSVLENRYNGFDFSKSADGFWVTKVQYGEQPYFIPFYYHPRETEDVIVHANVTRFLLANPPARVVLSLDPDAGSRPVIAGVEISRITGSKYDILNIPTSSALSKPSNLTVQIPVVSCTQQEVIPDDTVVIEFVEDPDANAIVRDGPCVLLFYKTPEDAIRVADRYAYQLLQIMQ